MKRRITRKRAKSAHTHTRRARTITQCTMTAALAAASRTPTGYRWTYPRCHRMTQKRRSLRDPRSRRLNRTTKTTPTKNLYGRPYIDRTMVAAARRRSCSGG
ncbi:hypothetical protein JYU34_012777 [Plutella xylostella]|uniref:Secreted protein n=1 Tax=Plutella xylostella TaxID=51655 RepID=A0ABQ7QC56_PLUXY|nr:hypothetical protein JYU34_012777 [Plutella xylostella]